LLGQEAPLYPVSYRIFDSFIFNPAIAGSKDFLSVDFISGKHDNNYSQVLSGNLRLLKPQPEYFASNSAPEFTHIGVGGFLFNDLNDSSRNIGFGGTVSYHLQIDKDALSFFSFGISLKAILNRNPGSTDLSMPAKSSFEPKIDVGVYYYTPHFFAGLSTTNLPLNKLFSKDDNDSTGFYALPVSTQLIFQLGYKLTLVKSYNIVLEPSIMLISDYKFKGKMSDIVKPALKLYAGNFCMGTYFNDFSKIPVFFQYKYPRFYIGSYIEIPRDSPFYKKPLLLEFTAGLNISALKSGISRNYHW
jgi:hypothetical protein